MCFEKQPRRILTEKDLLPYIMNLRHSKWAWENKLYNYVGDELRLYLASISDDFLYIDADVVVENIKDIKMDCCPRNKNNGTYFRANKNTEWVKYYLDIYETEEIGKATNMMVFDRYPYPIPLQNDIKYCHYFTSFWERWKKRDMNIRHEILFDAETEDEIRTMRYKDKYEWHYYKGFEYLV